MSYQYILKSDNPDKNIEYFWLNFKGTISSFLDVEQKKEIEILSKNLNKLQLEKKYIEIEEFIMHHLEKIGYEIMRQDNYYKANLLETNIKRWKKISSKDITSNNNKFYNIFKLYMTFRNRDNENKQEIINKIEKTLPTNTITRQHGISSFVRLIQNIRKALKECEE